MPWPPSSELLAPLAPWFDQVRRDLPWRATDLDAPHPDPYAVLVSELMLQQTQVATVIPYFERWMARFPTATALASAPDDAIHKAWEGLGYYRRARFLKAAAASVAARGWPRELDGLAALPGLGPYTAAAVGAIAFQRPTPALDGNAFRVLARLLGLEGDSKLHAAELRRWLVPALAQHGPSRLTQALMELGATRCMPAPLCATCPLAAACVARQTGRTAELPPPRTRPRVRDVQLWLLAIEAEGHFLLHAPSAKGLLAGLWRWPTAAPEAHPADCTLTRGLTTWPGWTQVYTHRREAICPLHLALPSRFHIQEGLRWVPREELTALPMGRRDQRLRSLLGHPGRTTLMEGPDPEGLAAAFRRDAGPGM